MMASQETMKTIHLIYPGDDDDGAKALRSLPGTPERAARRIPGWDKEYASESEGRKGRRRRRKGWGRSMRERWVDEEWEKRRDERGGEGECRLLVRPMGPDSASICMDLMEVKACRDLGLELPCDWTVEIPGGVAGVDGGGGGSSPIANLMISNPGDDPKDVKARLKVWAQAVALASASHLSS